MIVCVWRLYRINHEYYIEIDKMLDIFNIHAKLQRKYTDKLNSGIFVMNKRRRIHAGVQCKE